MGLGPAAASAAAFPLSAGRGEASHLFCSGEMSGRRLCGCSRCAGEGPVRGVPPAAAGAVGVSAMDGLGVWAASGAAGGL